MPPLTATSRTIIRSAADEDYSSVQKLLEEVNLPVAGVKEHFRDFLVLVDDHQLIGTVGLEIYGPNALLRSMAVANEHQRKGHGKRLYDAVLQKARDRQSAEIYLLTETAESFFAAQGFERIDRELVDEGVQTAEEFRSICPSTATCMRLNLV